MPPPLFARVRVHQALEVQIEGVEDLLEIEKR